MNCISALISNFYIFNRRISSIVRILDFEDNAGSDIPSQYFQVFYLMSNAISTSMTSNLIINGVKKLSKGTYSEDPDSQPKIFDHQPL